MPERRSKRLLQADDKPPLSPVGHSKSHEVEASAISTPITRSRAALHAASATTGPRKTRSQSKYFADEPKAAAPLKLPKLQKVKSATVASERKSRQLSQSAEDVVAATDTNGEEAASSNNLDDKLVKITLQKDISPVVPKNFESLPTSSRTPPPRSSRQPSIFTPPTHTKMPSLEIHQDTDTPSIPLSQDGGFSLSRDTRFKPSRRGRPNVSDANEHAILRASPGNKQSRLMNNFLMNNFRDLQHQSFKSAPIEIDEDEDVSIGLARQAVEGGSITSEVSGRLIVEDTANHDDIISIGDEELPTSSPGKGTALEPIDLTEEPASPLSSAIPTAGTTDMTDKHPILVRNNAVRPALRLNTVPTGQVPDDEAYSPCPISPIQVAYLRRKYEEEIRRLSTGGQASIPAQGGSQTLSTLDNTPEAFELLPPVLPAKVSAVVRSTIPSVQLPTPIVQSSMPPERLASPEIGEVSVESYRPGRGKNISAISQEVPLNVRSDTPGAPTPPIPAEYFYIPPLEEDEPIHNPVIITMPLPPVQCMPKGKQRTTRELSRVISKAAFVNSKAFTKRTWDLSPVRFSSMEEMTLFDGEHNANAKLLRYACNPYLEDGVIRDDILDLNHIPPISKEGRLSGKGARKSRGTVVSRKVSKSFTKASRKRQTVVERFMAEMNERREELEEDIEYINRRGITAPDEGDFFKTSIRAHDLTVGIATVLEIPSFTNATIDPIEDMVTTSPTEGITDWNFLFASYLDVPDDDMPIPSVGDTANAATPGDFFIQDSDDKYTSELSLAEQTIGPPFTSLIEFEDPATMNLDDLEEEFANVWMEDGETNNVQNYISEESPGNYMGDDEDSGVDSAAENVKTIEEEQVGDGVLSPLTDVSEISVPPAFQCSFFSSPEEEEAVVQRIQEIFESMDRAIEADPDVPKLFIVPDEEIHFGDAAKTPIMARTPVRSPVNTPRYSSSIGEDTLRRTTRSMSKNASHQFESDRIIDYPAKVSEPEKPKQETPSSSTNTPFFPSREFQESTRITRRAARLQNERVTQSSTEISVHSLSEPLERGLGNRKRKVEKQDTTSIARVPMVGFTEHAPMGDTSRASTPGSMASDRGTGTRSRGSAAPRRSAGTSVESGFVHRFYDIRESHGDGEGEAAGDDDVDMV